MLQKLSDEEIKKDFSIFSQSDLMYFFTAEDRRKSLLTLSDLGLNLYSANQWKHLAQILPSLAACDMNRVVYSQADNEKIYNESKICLNINHKTQADHGMSWRVPDIMATGGCLVSSYSPYIKETFKNYVDIPMFDNEYDARILCQKVLNDEKWRADIVAGSNAAIEKEGRWVHSLKKIEDFLNLKITDLNRKGILKILEPVIKTKSKVAPPEHSLKKDGSKKLKIFAIVGTEYTNTFDTLYYEAKKRKDIDFNFVVIPFRTSFYNTPMEKMERLMDEKKYPYIKGYDEQADKYLDLKQLNPDAVFVQSPYDIHRYSFLYSTRYFATFCACYHISYGCSLLDYDRPPYDYLVRVFNPHAVILNENTMMANYLGKYHRNVPIGYIKCDKYLNYIDNPDFHFKKRPDYKRIIAWKPRWVGVPGESTFLKYVDFFIEYCQKNPDTLLYFIKHDLMKNNMVNEKKVLTEEEFDNIFNKMEALNNIEIISHGDFLDDVFNADIFVGDYCSTIIEFALSGKPVLYTPTNVFFNKFGKKVSKGFYFINSVDEMKKRLFDLFEKNEDPLQKQREKLRGIISDTHDSQTIAQYLIEYLMKNIEKDKQYCHAKTKKISWKNKIRYKIWKHLNKKLKKKGIIP